MERDIKDGKQVNVYLNKNIIDQVKNSKQIKEDIDFLSLLLTKVVDTDKLDQNQINDIKEIVSKQKKTLGEVLKSAGFAQEEVDYGDISSDDENPMKVI